jgi:serine/threonine-protein kinase
MDGAVELALATNNLDDARKAIAELELVAPSYPDLWTFKGILAERTGNPEEASALFNKAVRLRPSWWQLVNLASFELRQGGIEAARNNLNQALSIAPGNLTALAKLAQLELVFGSPKKAKGLYLQVLSISPNPISMMNLATAQLLLGEYQEAADRYQQVLEGGANHPEIIIGLADCHNVLGNRERANELYRQALEALEDTGSSANPGALALRAQCFAQLGQTAQSISVIREALGHGSSSSEVNYCATLVFTRAGDEQSALAHAISAVRLGMNSHWFNLPWFESVREDPEFQKLYKEYSPDSRPHS